MDEPSEQPPNAIQAEGLGRRFGRNWVIRDLNLEVPPGSITALLGRNGIGKSTTIQVLLGLLPASEGTVRILGQDPVKLGPKVFQDVGYVSEKRELLEDQSVSGLTRIVAEIYGQRFDTDRFEELRKRFELAPKARCKTLSKGQRARLLLALAIAARPKILVLDEPTSGLDVVVRDDFLGGIAEFAAEEGQAVLLSTHMIEDVARICDRAVILRTGRPALTGETDQLRASVQRYLVRLTGVLPTGCQVPLPHGAVILERDPRALTILSSGAPEHLEAALDQALPLAGIERQPASLKEAFTCLSAAVPGDEA
ncbi:MAG: ABC transporter ATP-binding protein [Planctomycetes bacterium]|nr:ABC transporter ATP-binding protein [Planctomycetota bacterium]